MRDSETAGRRWAARGDGLVMGVVAVWATTLAACAAVGSSDATTTGDTFTEPVDASDGGCPPGHTDCAGSCVDLATDAHNCGWCGNECAAPHANTVGVCQGGSCGWECAPGWVDNDGEPGCETSCPAGGTEECNGVDDDCDEVVDDGFACAWGSDVECVTTCGTYGTGTCTAECAIPEPAECTPPVEECNGVDDDCDGDTDEDFPPGSCGTCTPDCGTRECGPDPVCGVSCGTCTLPETCDDSGMCECTPECGTQECGPDPVCGVSCGTCEAPETCNAWGECVCIPDCGGRVCGPDPVCALSCGTCTPPATCNATGQCESTCTPECGTRECGPDPVCGMSCGTCTLPETCNASGECVCLPDCGTRECGPDPDCGVSCGTCEAPETCDGSGMCVCTPECGTRECGPDPVCGVSCGTCTPPDDHCVEGNLRQYDPGGSCEDGSCTYTYTDVDCPDLCHDGACVECVVDDDCTGDQVCNASNECVEGGCLPPVESCSSGGQNRQGCSNARIIGRTAASGGYWESDDTCGLSDDHNDSISGCYDSGPDHTYRIYMLEGERLDVVADPGSECGGSGNWYMTFKLYGNSGCEDTACSDWIICEKDLLSYSTEFMAPHDGWFILVVDGTFSMDAGSYTLDVDLDCNEPDCDC